MKGISVPQTTALVSLGRVLFHCVLGVLLSDCSTGSPKKKFEPAGSATEQDPSLSDLSSRGGSSEKSKKNRSSSGRDGAEQSETTDEPPPPASMPSPNEPPPALNVSALHNPSPATCAGCHEKKRPSPTHYAGNDCAMCHKFPSFAANATFTHVPKPTSCESCHARPTRVGTRAYPNQGPPASFVPTDPKAIGGGHYVGKDCVECHETPKPNALKFAFAHSSPNPQVCLPCHYNEGFAQHRARQNFVGFGACASCHPNFSVTTGRNFGRN